MARAARIILLLLLVGASINVLVALSCSYSMYPMFVKAEVADVGTLSPVIKRLSDHPMQAATTWSDFGARERNVLLFPTSSDYGSSLDADEALSEDDRTARPSELATQLQSIYEEILVPDPTKAAGAYNIRQQLAVLRRPHGQLIMHESGWPFRSMAGAIYWDSDNNTTTTNPQESWAMHYDRPFGQGARRSARLLPLRPKPIPFLINTVIYTLAVWLMIITVRSGRARWRIRCGRCTVCRYHLHHARHDICPECGTPCPPITAH